MVEVGGATEGDDKTGYRKTWKWLDLVGVVGVRMRIKTRELRRIIVKQK